LLRRVAPRCVARGALFCRVIARASATTLAASAMAGKPAITTLPSERAAPLATADGRSVEPDTPRPPRDDDAFAPPTGGLWGAEASATNTPLPPLADVALARRRCETPRAAVLEHAC
jgi:hypothetical protein